MAVKRLTFKEVMNKTYSELHSMTDRDFARAVRTVGDVVNKRIKRFEESGLYSSAVESFKNTGDDRIRTAGKNREELEEELFRAKTFLSKEDSSLNFFSKLKREAGERTKKRKTKKGEKLNLTERELSKMWKIWDNYVDTHIIDRTPGSPVEALIYRFVVLDYKNNERHAPSAKWLKDELENIYKGKYIWDGEKALVAKSWVDKSTDRDSVYDYDEFGLINKKK